MLENEWLLSTTAIDVGTIGCCDGHVMEKSSPSLKPFILSSPHPAKKQGEHMFIPPISALTTTRDNAIEYDGIYTNTRDTDENTFVNSACRDKKSDCSTENTEEETDTDTSVGSTCRDRLSDCSTETESGGNETDADASVALTAKGSGRRGEASAETGDTGADMPVGSTPDHRLGSWRELMAKMATMAPGPGLNQDEWNDFISWMTEKAPEVPGDGTMWEITTKLPPPSRIEPNDWKVFLLMVEVDLVRAGMVPKGAMVSWTPSTSNTIMKVEACDERHHPQNQAEESENCTGLPQRPHTSNSPGQPQLSIQQASRFIKGQGNNEECRSTGIQEDEQGRTDMFIDESRGQAWQET
jgi:hypothetical protein